MAQRVITQLVDDLDGKEGEDIATVRFGFEGAQYEIDLNEKNARKLRRALDPYIEAGRRVGSARNRRSATKQAGPTAQEIRFWAQAQNIAVNERGRIPAEVKQAYLDAH